MTDLPFIGRVCALSFSAVIAFGACGEKKERKQVGGDTNTTKPVKDADTAPVAPPMHPKAVVPKGPAGTLTGVIKFSGTAPEMPLINAGSDPECAKKKLRAETILVNDNSTLKNVLVRIKPKTIPALKPDQPIIVQQNDCMYRPRIQGAVVGQELLVYNNDETAHNVHVRAAQIGDRQGKDALWNRQQPKKSSNLPPIKSMVEDHPVMRLKCDQHGWMSGYLVISDNPFSVVTGDNGSFEMKVPAGDLVIEAWHEFYGLKEGKVTVKEGETATIEFSFDATADNPTAKRQKGT